MCGIAFSHNSPSNKLARMEEALSKLIHRGPDETNVVNNGAACFGHVRLSILDIEHSHQPMQAVNERYTLVFNGEIYNYLELRKQLTTKWNFETDGDTEVLLAGLVIYGNKILEHLEGMWAFAFWDAEKRELILSRDRMGKKPLYYHNSSNFFACASELPSLESLLPFQYTEDIHSVADYFRYGYCLPGYTSWKNIFEVLPGHWLCWKPGEVIKQQPYWTLVPTSVDVANPKDVDLIDALEEAVSKRLIADVEVAAFLSGGIDSSLICSIAQSHMTKVLKTYTIGFTEKAFDERSYARAAANHIGTEHHEKELKRWDEAQLERLLKHHIGQPFADASLLPTALVSELAAQDVKVALSGDGGDELFGGYQRYQARIIMQWYSRLPGTLQKYAERVIHSLPEPMAHHSRSVLKKAKLFIDIATRSKAETPYFAPLMYHPEEYENIFPDLNNKGHCPPSLLNETGLDDLQRMLFADSLIYLPQDILVKVDRASMAFGLEVRAPFLDHKVVELAFSMPVKKHLRLGNGKRWLKKVFYDRLPSSVWKRRKQGFAVPIHQWFRESLGDRFRESIESSPGVISQNMALKLLKEHQEGKRDNGYRLWMMFAYLAFLKS
jgi:asparagine synthase (glutamine-hydrolysing)